jgi:N-acetylglucosaminyl-diphospho-decaprenol L-rhamnosyltransferase
MSAAVIIVAHHSESTLPACLASVLAARSASEVIIVDHSPHRRCEPLARAVGAAYYSVPTNPGFAAGANFGAQLVTTHPSFLLFLNPDTLLPASALNLFTNFFTQHPDVGIVGPRLVSATGRPDPDSFGPPVTPLTLFTRHLFPSSQVGWVSGACLAIRYSLFQALGGFDPHFFLYWEDVDLCRRARVGGYKVAALPRLRVFHQRGHSAVSSLTTTAHYDQSADTYFRKHYPTPVWQLQRLLRSLYRLFQPRSR